METLLKIIGWLVAIILLPFVVVSFAGFLFTNTVASAPASPANVIAALDQQDFYEEIAPFVLPAIVERIPTINLNNVTINLNTIIMNMDEPQLAAISREVIPPEWLQEQVGDAIQRTLSGLNGDTTIAETSLDLTQIRERLTGPEGTRAAEIILANALPCTPDQAQELLVLLQDDSGSRPTIDYICNPPEQYQQFMREVIARAQANLAENLQDAIPNPFAPVELQQITANTLLNITGLQSRIISADTPIGILTLEIPEMFGPADTSQDTTGDSPDENPDAVQGEPANNTGNSTLSTIFNLEYLRTVLGSLIAPFLILTVFILFMVRTIRGLSNWWGLVMLFTGFFLLMLVPTSVSLIDSLSGGLRAGGVSRNILPVQSEILTGLIKAVDPLIREPLLIQGGILLIIGIILLVGAFIIPRMFRDDDDDAAIGEEHYFEDTQQLGAMIRR